MESGQERGRTSRRLVAHLGVGGVCVGVDLALLVTLRAGGLPLPVATTAAYGGGVLLNFALNRRLHGDAARDDRGALRRYLLLLLANYLVTLGALTGAQRRGLPYLPVKLAVVAAVALWNYPLYRTWVFRGSRPAPVTR